MFKKKSFTTSIIVRYCETDAMSYSHHSNYLKYYEVGRLNWLKKLGFSYFKMEKNDIILDGGKLTIDWLESEDVIMSGEVNLVFKGNFYCD